MGKYISITFSAIRNLLVIAIFLLPIVFYCIGTPFSVWISIPYCLISAIGLGLLVVPYRAKISIDQIYYAIIGVFTLIGLCIIMHLWLIGFPINSRFVFIVYTIFACLYLVDLKELLFFLASMMLAYTCAIYFHPSFEDGVALMGRYLFVVLICYMFVSSKIRALEYSNQNNIIYRKLFDNINEGIIIVDNNGVFLDLNKKMLELTGYTKEELIGGVSHEIFLFKEDVEFMRKQTEQRKSGTNARYEIRVKKKEEGFLWCLISGIPMTNKKGETIGSMGICADITDLKAANLNLKEKSDKLEEVNRQLMLTNQDLEQFAYTASHDLQAPLRTIASFSQLLSKRYKDKIEPDANEYIDFIIDGCKKMSSLIHGVLDFAKARTQELDKTTVYLNSVVANTIRQLHVQLREKEASILFEELPAIHGDKIQIRQLFQNLIENALKYSKKEVKPIIHISHYVKGDKLLIEIADNGIGIDEAFQEKIFKLFQRLHLANNYSGIGIGLSICKKIMENHDGDISFKSKEGEGTTFILSFPKSAKVKPTKRKTALGQKAVL